MSTRSQIEFTIKYKDQDGKAWEEKRTIYRHSDGYPEGVIPDLVDFLIWNYGRNADIEYQTANFVYWSKKQMEQYLNHDDDVSKDHNSPVKLGFGICNNGEIHGDVAYFYKVINDQTENKKFIGGSDNIIIESYKVTEKGKMKRVEIYKVTQAMLQGKEKIQVKELEN